MKILFFGRLAESLGREVVLDDGDSATIADVRNALVRRYPHSAGDLAAPRARACVNDAMSGEDRIVGPADEIAFFPPLSGG